MSHERRQAFIEMFRQEVDPEILLELDHDVKEEVISLLGVQESAEAIITLETDDAVDVIEDLDEDFVVLPDKIDKVREYILSNVG